MRRHLVVIDPQRDFCKPEGALYVPGADDDMRRLAASLERETFEHVHVTLDSHGWLHIAHPIFWVGTDGWAPDPFTSVSVADVRDGVWRARDPRRQERALQYVESLARGGRYGLTIWPPHCVLGTPGHAVHDELMDALRAWSERSLTPIDFVMKGANPYTEHYSAIQADVPDPEDPSTLPNRRFVETLSEADEIVVAGEALDFCLLNTVRDLVALAPELTSRIVVLRDATSPIGPCSLDEHAFFRELWSRGARLSTA